MSKTVQELEYIARINRVIDYIQTNLNKPICLKDIAEVANFSPYHFHRLFRAIVGETLTSYIQRLRVEKAASMLIANFKSTITEVAFDSGFSSSAAFARLFRDHFGISASQWRIRQGRKNSKNCKANRNNGKEDVTSLRYFNNANDGGAARSSKEASIKIRGGKKMTDLRNTKVSVKDMAMMTVAYVRHIGPYKGDTKLFENLWKKLMTWAGPRGILQQTNVKCLCVYHDDPEVTDSKNLRLSVCVSVPQDTKVDGEIGKMDIPAGVYAMAHFEIGGDEFQDAWDYVYGVWMPKSGYQPDDRPCYELCLNNPAEHPKHKHIVEICVPVKPL